MKTQQRMQGGSYLRQHRDVKRIKLSTFRVGTWNVHTMLQIGKMNEIAEETLKYNVNITAVQQVRWKDSGKINKKNFTFFYSESERTQGEYGMGFIVDTKTKQSVIRFEPVNN